MSRFDDPFANEQVNRQDAAARAARLSPHVLGVATGLVDLEPTAPEHQAAAALVGEHIQRRYGLSPELGSAVLAGAGRHIQKGLRRGEA